MSLPVKGVKTTTTKKHLLYEATQMYECCQYNTGAFNVILREHTTKFEVPLLLDVLRIFEYKRKK